MIIPDGDIEIVEVGLRPGEKLYEELIIGNNPQSTQHERIMKAHEVYTRWPDLIKILHALKETRDRSVTIKLLESLVSDFEHGRDNADIEKAS